MTCLNSCNILVDTMSGCSIFPMEFRMVWFADYAKLEKRLQPLNRVLLCRNMESEL